MAVAASLMTPGDLTAVPDAPPILLEVARAESNYQQFKADGTLLRDSVTGDHIGIYQISITVWDKKAKQKGWDIRTPQGNIAMALWIYKNYGTQPWLASKYGKYGWSNAKS